MILNQASNLRLSKPYHPQAYVKDFTFTTFLSMFTKAWSKEQAEIKINHRGFKTEPY